MLLKINNSNIDASRTKHYITMSACTDKMTIDAVKQKSKD